MSKYESHYSNSYNTDNDGYHWGRDNYNGSDWTRDRYGRSGWTDWTNGNDFPEEHKPLNAYGGGEYNQPNANAEGGFNVATEEQVTVAVPVETPTTTTTTTQMEERKRNLHIFRNVAEVEAAPREYPVHFYDLPLSTCKTFTERNKTPITPAALAISARLGCQSHVLTSMLHDKEISGLSVWLFLYCQSKMGNSYAISGIYLTKFNLI